MKINENISRNRLRLFETINLLFDQLELEIKDAHLLFENESIDLNEILTVLVDSVKMVALEVLEFLKPDEEMLFCAQVINTDIENYQKLQDIIFKINNFKYEEICGSVIKKI